MADAFWLCRTAEECSTAQSSNSCIPVVKGQICSGIAALEFLRGLLLPESQRLLRCQSIFGVMLQGYAFLLFAFFGLALGV